MTATLSRADELRNDIENMRFTCKYYVGVLNELKQLGRTNTADFKQAEANIRILNHNIKRVEKELESYEA